MAEAAEAEAGGVCVNRYEKECLLRKKKVRRPSVANPKVSISHLPTTAADMDYAALRDFILGAFGLPRRLCEQAAMTPDAAFNESPPGNDWRAMNESLMKPDDCRRCCGMGRVPFAETEFGARYRDCPDCAGTGRKP
jgi:hypothetical protein